MILQKFKVKTKNKINHRFQKEIWDQGKDFGNLRYHQLNKFQLVFFKILYRFFDISNIKIPSLFNKKNENYLVFFLGPDFGKLIYPKIMGYNVIPIMMDAWNNYHPRIDNAIKILDLKDFYFSSSQVAQKFKEKYPDRNIAWLPEAVKVEDYSIIPFQERSIDLFSFGRNNIEYYNKIKPLLKEKKIKYLIQEPNKPLILPKRKDFDHALKNAKISVCFPGSLTDPKKYQGIETVTWRYFQCMASKVLILGKAPKELIDLFGYNPVVEIDKDDPIKQILEILEFPEQYQKLIEKNYLKVITENQWKNRIQTFNYINNDVC